jgi:Fe-S cluster biogenesis protein NfuA/nitrite reductase/ring-hydroxylating ferredoxin subunit
MPRQTEFERRIAAIDELVQQLETAADPSARAASQELVRALMELHGAALERMLATIRRNGAAGATIVDQLTREELVASVLLLYDLHPVDLETRVRGALEKNRPYLKSHGGNCELVAIDDGVVRLRMEGSCHGCPSSAVTLKLAIEQAIHEAAPDVTAILVEGRTDSGHEAAPALIALGVPGSTNGHNGHGDPGAGWQDVPGLGRLANGATRREDVDGREVLFCRLEEDLYAYAARCPVCEADLVTASLAGRLLCCPGCGQAYDVVQAGRAPDRPDLHLDPFPLLTRNGRTQVALPSLRVAAAPA